MNRNLIERERRSNMRHLFSRLFSLLPPPITRRSAIPDRLDQATVYINQIRTRLEELNGRRLQLEGGNRGTGRRMTMSPVINISEYSHDSVMEINLITASELNLSLSEIIRVIQEEGAEVLTLTYGNESSRNILTIHCQAAITCINGIDRSRLLQRLRIVIEE